MARTFRGMWTRLIFVFALAATALAQSPVSDDTFVTSASPSSTNGSSPSLVVQAPAGWTFIKLDLSRIPAGTQASAVSKATLKLYVTAATAQGAFDVFRVDSTWKEANLTYSNSTLPNQSAQALVLTPISTGTCSGTPVQCVTTSSKYVIVDVTNIVKDWLNFQNGVGGAHANNGIAFKPSSGSSISVTFESKESTTTSHDTDLEVDYNTSLASIPGTIGPSQVSSGTYAINISGTAATAAAFDHLTTQCPANQFSIGITTAGHANCTLLPAGIVFNNQANTFGAGFKQTFTPSAALAGLNIVGAASDPTTLTNGDLWFNTTSGRLGLRTAGVTKQLAFTGDAVSGDGSGLTNLNASQLSNGTVPAPRLSGTYGISITGSAGTITGNIDESQVNNLPTHLNNLTTSINNEASARTAADTTLQNNINSETSARTGADTTLQNNINAEAATRAVADSTLGASIASETSRAQSTENTITGNLNNEISRATAAEATKADLVKPVQIDNTAAVNGSCAAANALVLNPNADSGQQMFICRDIGGGTLQWQLINDDDATTAADHTYTDQQVLAEATARQNADAAEVSARQSADATLQANIDAEATARAAADATEAAARIAGDAASVATSGAYTNSAVTTINNSLATKANLAGGNSFSGTQTVNGTLSLPATGTGPSPSQAFEMAGSDAGNQATLFRWQVNNTGLLNLFTATNGNAAADSGLKIGSDGKITFAAGQTFPGTQSALTAGSGISILSNTISNTGALSFNGRNGAVTPQSADYSFAQISGTITPSQAGAGTYGIDISGNAATATSAVTAASATTAASAAAVPFSGVTTGSNTTALTIGTGGSLLATGTGVIDATQLGGVAAATYVRTDQANTYNVGSKQTFKASATVAGLNIFGVATDPTGPLAAGDIWYRSDLKRLQLFNGTSTNPFATTAGTLTSGHCASFDANGNIVDNGGACSAGTVTSVTAGDGTITIGGTASAPTVAVGQISNANVAAAAGIADTKLATISTAGKVSNSATTATSANTASAIVARDASGNFSAGTITATLNGNASTATSATTATTAGNVTGTVAVGNGGTGLTGGTSGGILGFTAAGTLASSAALTSNAVVLGGGAGATPKTAAGFTTNGTSAMTLGAAGTGTGALNLAGTTSGTVTLQPQAAAGTFNFNLPTTAGAAGTVLTSGGGGAAPMTWTTPSTGTVTNVATGTGLTGGPITSTGTIALANTAVTAGTYTAANITVDAQGRLTAASSNTLTNGTVTSVATGAGLTGGPVTTSGTIDMTTAQKTRTICYVAGADNNSTALDTTFSQKSFFANMVGPMTAVATGLRCQTDAGTATIQINKNGGAAGTLSNALNCTTSWGANAGSFNATSIALNDVLDFSITATSGAKRVTACLSATVN
jgi:hypothetical protein